MNWIKRLIFPLALSLLCTVFTISFSKFDFELAFWGTFFFTAILFLTLVNLFFSLGPNKFVGWVIISAFLLRFLLGLVTTYHLIDWGYDEIQYTYGYLFRDSYNRDLQAWEFLKTGKPLWALFTTNFFSDQYGGLLALSTVIYKVFTPLAHVKMNIITLVVTINLIGVNFLAKGLLEKEKSTHLSSNSKVMILIFAFYPDSIVFGASQMREPILLGLSGFLFWLIQKPSLKLTTKVLFASLSAILILVVSLKIGLFILFAFLLWFIYQSSHNKKTLFNSKIIFVSLAVFVLVVLYFSYSWIIEAAKWDALVLERNSGFVQYIVSTIGSRYRLVFASLYGLFQPVLPAALIEPSKLFWKILNSMRALGWYLVMPFLSYGIIYFFREKNKEKKYEFLLVWGLSIFWIILSSIRAGGDMWDNPRYRLNFLLFIAFSVSQSLSYGLKNKDHWLTKIFIAEGFFILFFLIWYISRYTGLIKNLPFFPMVIILTIIFLLILLTGIIQEIKNKKNQSISNGY